MPAQSYNPNRAECHQDAERHSVTEHHPKSKKSSTKSNRGSQKRGPSSNTSATLGPTGSSVQHTYQQQDRYIQYSGEGQRELESYSPLARWEQEQFHEQPWHGISRDLMGPNWRGHYAGDAVPTNERGEVTEGAYARKKSGKGSRKSS